MLVDDGKLAWDAPVRRFLPEFAMSDAYVSDHLTVRDLLVHRSGLALGAGDLLRWPDGDATDAEMVEALRYLPLETGFRDRFAYDNILYAVAGELIARVSGQAWGDFVSARLFRPLGLTSCTTDPDRLRPANWAIEHARASGGDTGRPLARVQSETPGVSAETNRRQRDQSTGQICRQSQYLERHGPDVSRDRAENCQWIASMKPGDPGSIPE
jgi:CubicO group peptidase (beta-lactamase class C family)